MKYKLILILLIIFFSDSENIFSQKEAYNWFFADSAGITFNTPNVVPIADTNGRMTLEYKKWNLKTLKFGTMLYKPATISDKKTGELLFYSDGIKILNKNHKIMDILDYNFYNDTSTFNRSYHIFCTCIVPDPGDSTRYNIITLKQYEYKYYDRKSRLQYHLIDMNIKKNGTVIKKNINVEDGNNLYGNLTTARHRNGKDFWIVSHSWIGRKFYAFLLTENGLSEPVMSVIGDYYDIYDDNVQNHRFGGGDMRISPDGEYLVATYFAPFTPELKSAMLFKFNNETGRISQPVNLINKNFAYAPGNAEFSPDGTKLYLKITYDNSPKIRLYQYDLESETINELLNSRVNITKNKDISPGNLQLAPNGKIYLSSSKHNYLHVINHPNKKGTACDIEADAVYLGGRMVWRVLPEFMPNFFFEAYIRSNSPLCEGDTIKLRCNGVNDAQWEWKGPNDFTSDKQNPVIPNANVDDSGIYKVKLTMPDGREYYDSTEVIVLPNPDAEIEADGPLSFCDGDSAALRVTTETDSNEIYWSTGDTSNEITVTETGEYSATVTNTHGCESYVSTTITVFDNPEPELKLIGDNTLCTGDSAIVTTKNKYQSYNWSTGESSDSIVVDYTAEIWVQVTDSNGCTGYSDTISIEKYDDPAPDIQGPATVCLNTETEYYIENAENLKTEWKCDLGTIVNWIDNDKIVVRWDNPGTGKIIITATDKRSGCVGYDTLAVNVSDTLKPEISYSSLYICEGEEITLSAPEGFEKYRWSTGETTREITVGMPGEYSVWVQDEYGCEGTSDPVEVKQAPTPEPEIIGPAKFCEGETITLSVEQEYVEYLWNTGETTKDIETDKPEEYIVTVTSDKGCEGRDTIYIDYYDIDISNLSDIQFSNISIGSSEEKTLQITNNGADPVKIERAYIKGLEGNIISITTNPPLPHTFQTDEILEIKITFSPVKSIQYTDSVYVEVTEPCPEELSSEIKGGGDISAITVWFPELEGEVDTKNFRIPLKAQIDTKDQTFDNFTYSANVSFDAEMFLPRGLTTGNITSNTVENNERIFEIEGGGTDLGNNEKILTEIIGDIILSGKEETPLKINDFSITPDAEVTTQDGKLVTTGVCANFLRGVQSFTPDNLQVSPNPATGAVEINVSIYEKGGYTIKLYDQQGRKLREYSWKQDSSSEKILTWDLGELPSGVYNLVLQTRWEVFRRTVTVVR